MLHGAASFQQVATPTKGWWISSSFRPIAVEIRPVRRAGMAPRSRGGWVVSTCPDFPWPWCGPSPSRLRVGLMRFPPNRRGAQARQARLPPRAVRSRLRATKSRQRQVRCSIQPMPSSWRPRCRVASALAVVGGRVCCLSSSSMRSGSGGDSSGSFLDRGQRTGRRGICGWGCAWPGRDASHITTLLVSWRPSLWHRGLRLLCWSARWALAPAQRRLAFRSDHAALRHFAIAMAICAGAYGLTAPASRPVSSRRRTSPPRSGPGFLPLALVGRCWCRTGGREVLFPRLHSATTGRH